MSSLLEDAGAVEVGEDDAQRSFAATAGKLEYELADADAALWFDSPYQWVRNLPAARKSKAAERLVAATLAGLGVVPARSSGPGHDFVFAGERYKVRLSLRWSSGEFVFQQLGGGDSDLVCLLGLEPMLAHLWVVPKAELVEHAGAQTGWLQFPTARPPAWLSRHGGDLTAAAAIIRARRQAATD